VLRTKLTHHHRSRSGRVGALAVVGTAFSAAVYTIVQATPVIISRVPNAARQIFGISRIVAIARMAVIHLGRVLLVAVLPTSRIRRTGRDGTCQEEAAAGQ
jgi:hypothetical protein